MIASLLVVEVNGCLLHLRDLLLAISNLSNFLILTRIMLVNSLLLRLEIFEEERFHDTEWQLLIGLENLEDQER